MELQCTPKALPFKLSVFLCWILYHIICYFSSIITSVFMWSNESLNIWSHLVGGIWFLCVLVYDNYERIPSFKGELQDHFVVTTFDICFAVSILLFSIVHFQTNACSSWKAQP